MLTRISIPSRGSSVYTAFSSEPPVSPGVVQRGGGREFGSTSSRGLTLPHAPVLSARSGPVGRLAVPGTDIENANGRSELVHESRLVMPVQTVDRINHA